MAVSGRGDGKSIGDEVENGIGSGCRGEDEGGASVDDGLTLSVGAGGCVVDGDSLE